jgi:hypothetical protein
MSAHAKAPLLLPMRLLGVVSVLLVLYFAPGDAASGRNNASASHECDDVCRAEQRRALVYIYEATGGANWTVNRRWLTDEDHCTWFGIGCCGGDPPQLYDSTYVCCVLRVHSARRRRRCVRACARACVSVCVYVYDDPHQPSTPQTTPTPQRRPAITTIIITSGVVSPPNTQHNESATCRTSCTST